MQSIHVVAGLDPSRGGPSYTVPRLALELRKKGYEANILSLGKPSDGASRETQLYRQDWVGLPILGAAHASSRLAAALRVQAPFADVIHNHGLWLMPNVEAGWASKRANKPLIVSARGMLSKAALKYSNAKKRVFWAMMQGPAISRISAWHATSEEEATDIRQFGAVGPVAVIPNGVDLPTVVAAHAESTPRRTLLFLSRLHPKKGLPSLVGAWSKVAHLHPEWDLLVAGPDEVGHRSKLESQIQAAQVPRIKFLGAVYGAAKDKLIASADLFVLPTLNENFGIAVAEALAAAVPAIVTKGAPWRDLTDGRCGWWIDNGEDALEAALNEAMALPASSRRQMGNRGRILMEKDYSWDNVATKMLELYRWTKGSSDTPQFVR